MLAVRKILHSSSKVAQARQHVRWSPTTMMAAGKHQVPGFRNVVVAVRSLSSSFQFSSFKEPEPNIFSEESLAALAASSDQKARDFQLRADFRAMGSILGNIIRDHEGEGIFHKVEDMRSLAKAWRRAGAGRDASKAAEAEANFTKMVSYASSLSDKELFVVSRAFTHFLSLANAAESHHRTRLLRESVAASPGPLPNKSDSCGGVIPDLVDQYSPDVVYQALTSQTVELVLTAHPTEVNRRTILDKQRGVQKLLNLADEEKESEVRGKKAPSFVRQQLNDALFREISAIWQSDEVSRLKPTPQFEAERGTLVVETVLWEAVPQFLRKLNSILKDSLGKELPLDAAPIKFSSWMGGDRDGNPNVTPNVTREVCLAKRAKAASLFARDLMVLKSELSITNCSEELRAVVGDAREPYRDLLDRMISKMKCTEQWATQELGQLQGKQKSGYYNAISLSDVYLSKKELTNELRLIYQSLVDTGNAVTADGFLTDVLRNVSAFGLTLVPLDIRQESDRHEEAVDSITKFLGLGSYSQWDESTRLSWLQQQLISKRPLIRRGDWNNHPDAFSPTAVDTLETFSMIAEMHEGSLGAYVISQATSASDVLAVLLLQRDAGVKTPLRVVPLFETLDDLRGAAKTMRSLFSLPAYVGSIDGKQEVMIGYSDSAKDAGRLAASWAQYETQEELADVAKEFGIKITFFHGKGGTVGRGGNPQTFLAILAHAPDTINGQFRVTEQGEMINQNFGHVDRAERTMDIYTAAVLAEKLTHRPRPKKEWRDMMHTLSTISCDAYRRLVRGDARFVPYFRSATPELELSNLNIGSRPAKRKATGGVESLRAIPWIFAWTQTRLNLPTWLGVGDAIQQVLASDQASTLRHMYREWGSFRTTVDLVEMVLAKSEPAIANHYESMLVSDPAAKELGLEVRGLHAATEHAILDIADHTSLSENNKILTRALQVRNPYVDCLNILQAETLKRIRSKENGNKDKVLMDALMTTITGVANGMGNTG